MHKTNSGLYQIHLSNFRNIPYRWLIQTFDFEQKRSNIILSLFVANPIHH